MEKTIKISLEAYNRLIESKKKQESITEVILREVRPKPNQGNMLALFGTWRGESEEFNRIFGYLFENQRSTETRDIGALIGLLRLRPLGSLSKRLP